VSDFIRGEYLPDMCDMRYGTERNLPYRECLEVPDKEHVSIYAKTEHLCGAFNVIKNNPSKLFTLVTHNSDMPIQTCNTPDNLYRWFCQNRDTEQLRIHSLPIGLENEYWHPHKQQTLEDAPSFDTRIVSAFAQFNPATRPQDRGPLMRDLQSGEIEGDVYGCINGANYDLFVENLRRYAFCICPRGNGIDTHRMWEALYMRCIPIVQNFQAHNFNIDIHNKCAPLPILYVDNWREITPELLQHTHNSIDRSGFGSELLSVRYWKGLITNEN
tara:strand:- start:554 stop:1369 length:816 start_codon:yes stop_codon:yes gene_type:complete